jgi:hypothetical protein
LLNSSVFKQNFNGSWTPAEVGLWGAISDAAYASLQRMVSEQKQRITLSKVIHGVYDYFLDRPAMTTMLTFMALILAWK